MVDCLGKRLLPHLDPDARKMVHDTIHFLEEPEGIGVNLLYVVDLALAEFRTAIAAGTSEKRASSTPPQPSAQREPDPRVREGLSGRDTAAQERGHHRRPEGRRAQAQVRKARAGIMQAIETRAEFASYSARDKELMPEEQALEAQIGRLNSRQAADGRPAPDIPAISIARRFEGERGRCPVVSCNCSGMVTTTSLGRPACLGSAPSAVRLA